MDNKDEAFLKRLIATFKVEAAEHLASMSSCLLELEKSSEPQRQAVFVERVFREAHSMKGAARAVNMTDIESVCQSLENVFSSAKRREIVLGRDHFDVLLRIVDLLGNSLQSSQEGPAGAEKTGFKEMLLELERISKKGPPGEAVPKRKGTMTTPSVTDARPVVKKGEISAVADESGPTPEIVRMSAQKLGAVLLQAEEFLSEKLAIHERTAELRELNDVLGEKEKKWMKLRPNLRTIGRSIAEAGKGNPLKGEAGRIMKLIEFLEENADFYKSLRTRVSAMAKAAEADQRAVVAMVDNLTGTMKNVLMVPFSSLIELFPKIVRDLTRDQGKEAELVVRGGDVEIDRRVLDEIKDPLVHLVRNCIDHGIETAGEREKKGKPRRGSVELSAANAENKRVVLTVSDDGAGIDFMKVRDSAAKVGILPPHEAAGLSDDDALHLVFHSGVTTSPIITDISGRGLGLAIVKEKVDRLHGTVSCESRSGRTVFRIELPLTLTAFRGVVVRAEDAFFMVPTMSLERTLRVRRDDVRTVENRDTITFGGKTIPLVPLHAVLELPAKDRKNEDTFLHALVLAAAGKSIAFSVDEVLNEEEVLVKSLGRQLGRVRNVSGATVLGTGRVVPILNVSDLIKSAVKSGVSAIRAVTAEAGPAKKVLVVEDSITARTLLKNILETAGYDVKTAVDGVDAYTFLKTEAFDVVVSDVDMPRMNGFDLASKIRTDGKLSGLPVILVTALESREDRERGIDVGADAYIVKSSFDQSNLLEAIKRLI